MGRFVAVGYDIGYFIGQVTSAQSAESVCVNFLTRCKDGTYKWPRRKDMATLSSKYVFYSCPRTQQVGKAFVLHNEENVKNLFEDYQKKYMS